MDEFYAYLFGALVIFFILIFLFGINEEPGVLSYYGKGMLISPNKTKNITYLKESISLGDFDIKKVSKTFSKKIANVAEVKNGIFFGNKIEKISFYIEDPKLSKNYSLHFYFREGNPISSVRFSVNNETILLKKIIKGEHKITIPSPIIKEKNVLKIEADSSGIIFWAPNEYKFENLSIEYEKEEPLSPSKTFYIKKEIYPKISEAKLSFIVEEREYCKLKIELNKKRIVNKVFPLGKNEVELSKLDLSLGDNEILFSSNCLYKIRDAKIEYSYLNYEG